LGKLTEANSAATYRAVKARSAARMKNVILAA
jgi:hypothetical protein